MHHHHLSEVVEARTVPGRFSKGADVLSFCLPIGPLQIHCQDPGPQGGNQVRNQNHREPLEWAGPGL